MLHAYVDFRTPETPREMWSRVMVVTPQWVRQQLEEGTHGQSWPSLLIIPAKSIGDARRLIDAILAEGGWRVVQRNAQLVSVTDLRSEW
jgi:hypothetical protein